MLKKYLFQCNSKDYFQQKRVHTKDSEHNKHYEQHNYMKRSLATEAKPVLRPIDMEDTRKEELLKYRSISLFNKKQGRIPTSAEKCRSNDKIKVFNIFNSTPRKVQVNKSFEMLKGFQERVVYSSHNRQSSLNKPPSTSRVNDSINLKNDSAKPNVIPLRRFFHDKPPNISQNVQIEVEKQSIENILELFLLNTCELKKKFEPERKLQHSNSRQTSEEKAKIKVRNSHKFPKDFFL